MRTQHHSDPRVARASTPTDADARAMLSHHLVRLRGGAQRVAGIVLGCFAASQLVMLLRWRAAGAGAGEIAAQLLDVAAFAAAIWVAIPIGLRAAYASIVARGTVRAVRITQGPEPVHRRFGGMGGGPYMARGGVEALSTLLGRLLPTHLVNFESQGPGARSYVGALYPDESLPGGDVRYALVDPERPAKAWLLRRHAEHADVR